MSRTQSTSTWQMLAPRLPYDSSMQSKWLLDTSLATGSPRYAQELDLPGLRMWGLRRFPHLVFYMNLETHIDVWRVLHGERDLPGWLREP